MSPEIPIDEKTESPDPRSPHFYIKDTDLNNFSCLLKNTDWGTHIIDMDYNGRMISNNGLFDTIRVTFDNPKFIAQAIAAISPKITVVTSEIVFTKSK